MNIYFDTKAEHIVIKKKHQKTIIPIDTDQTRTEFYNNIADVIIETLSTRHIPPACYDKLQHLCQIIEAETSL